MFNCLVSAWCDGFVFHLAVAVPDMKKDTNNSAEALARLLEQLYLTWEALPPKHCHRSGQHLP